MMKSTTIQNLLSILMLLLGVTVLAGWIFHIPWMVQPRPDFVAMASITASCFILLALAFLAQALKIPRYRLFQEIVGWLLIGIGTMVLTEIIFHKEWFIDFR